MRRGAVWSTFGRFCTDWEPNLWVVISNFANPAPFFGPRSRATRQICTPAAPLSIVLSPRLERIDVPPSPTQARCSKKTPRLRSSQNGPSSWREQMRPRRGRAAGPRLRTHVAHPPAAASRLDGAPRPRTREITRHRRTPPKSPNLAHRLTAPETAVLRRERRSNVRGNERAGRREDAEPNARGSHTGR